jgi:uncharacterized protein YjaG (DUF416 family)
MIKRIKKLVKSETGKNISRKESKELRLLAKEIEIQNQFLKQIIKSN